MSQTTIVITIHGGLVQDVFCSCPLAEVILVDWDTEPCNRGDPCIVEVAGLHERRPRLAYVVEREVRPLDELPGTDTADAIEAAELSTCPATASPGAVL